VIRRVAGTGMLHPLAVVSLLVLVANDHVFKAWTPGFVTGKLSDFAGMALVPLFLQALFEATFARLRGEFSAESSNRVLAGAALATAVGFSLVELVPALESAFRIGIGLLQWPFRAVVCVATGDALPASQPVLATADATDLLALPMAWLAYRAGRVNPSKGRALGWRSSVALTLVSGAWPSTAAAADEPGSYLRDGFYLGGELGAGVAYLSSSASISNGFRQGLDSTAFGRVLPSFVGDAGGTFAQASLVLGGRVAAMAIHEPRVDSNGYQFIEEGSVLTLVSLQVFTHYYPSLEGGLYFGGALGLGSLNSSAFGELHRGPSLSLEGGYRAWISPNWSLGGVLRVSGARLEGEEFGVTTLVSPTCAVSLAWH
jgi:hypothetical protein